MKYLSQKEVMKMMEKEDKLTQEQKTLFEKQYARYRLQIISKKEFLTLLQLSGL